MDAGGGGGALGAGHSGNSGVCEAAHRPGPVPSPQFRVEENRQAYSTNLDPGKFLQNFPSSNSNSSMDIWAPKSRLDRQECRMPILMVSIALFSSLAFQVPNAPMKEMCTPPHSRQEHERVLRGDVWAMFEENRKLAEVGLPRPYSRELLIQKLAPLVAKKDLQAELATIALRGGTHFSIIENGAIDVGTESKEDNERARILIWKLAESGDPRYMKLRSLWLDREPKGQRDAKEIEYWYTRAWDFYETRARKGDVRAMVCLAHLMEPSTFPGIPITDPYWGPTVRAQWHKRAAESGDAVSMFEVGMGMMSSDACFEWFLKSANAGYWRAMLQVASFYAHGTVQILRGEAPKPDPVKAWLWLDRAIAQTGNPEVWNAYFDEDDGEDFLADWPARPGDKVLVRPQKSNNSTDPSS